MKFWTRFDLNWLLVVLLTVFAVAPLTYPGFFETHNGFLPVFNAEHLSDAPNWGRPADPPRSEGRLPYLLAWPFLQLSGSGIVAIKWGYAISLVLGALGIYVWARHWHGSKGGVLAAAVYTYLPWHLTTIYVRGAYAEAWLWALWPWILWAIDRLGETGPRNTLLAVGLGLPLLAATFWIQPGLASLATVLLVAYGVAVPTGQPRRLLRLVEVLVLALLLLWLAARRLPEARIPFGEHFVYPMQLFSAAWGNGLSFQLGLAAVGLSIVAVALCVSGRDHTTKTQDALQTYDMASSIASRSLPIGLATWFWVGTLLVLVLLSLPLSAWLWASSGLDRFLTYPWQLLALTSFPLVFLAGSVIRMDRRLATLPAWAGLVALVLLASYPYLAPQFTQVDPGPAPVALLQPMNADAPQIALLDYELQASTEIIPTLMLTMTWQAVAPVTDDYTVFAHVLSEGNTKVAQSDGRPCNGTCPTDTWQPGEILVDRHELILPPDTTGDSAQLLSGPYRLAVGLYLLETGERAAVVGRDDETVILDVP